MLEKLIEFAQKGNGRRLLNTLNKRDTSLTNAELDRVLNTYCKTGLPKQVEALKKRRGILEGKQYQAMAEQVRKNCCSRQYDDFAEALRNLLSSGMKMNPAKMDIEDQV